MFESNLVLDVKVTDKNQPDADAFTRTETKFRKGLPFNTTASKIRTGAELDSIRVIRAVRHVDGMLEICCRLSFTIRTEQQGPELREAVTKIYDEILKMNNTVLKDSGIGISEISEEASELYYKHYD